MREIFRLWKGAMTFDTPTFSALSASGDAFRKGFMVLLLVGLLVGLVNGGVQLAQTLSYGSATGEMQTVLGQIEQSMQQGFDIARQYGGEVDPEIKQMIMENIKAGFKIAEDVAKVPTPLPWPWGSIFEFLGSMASVPFAWLSSLILYGVFVHIFSRALGGQASVGQPASDPQRAWSSASSRVHSGGAGPGRSSVTARTSPSAVASPPPISTGVRHSSRSPCARRSRRPGRAARVAGAAGAVASAAAWRSSNHC